MNPAPETLAYAAGVIDSDGCIQIVRRKNYGHGTYSMRVGVTQVQEQIPLWFQRNFGGRVDRYQIKKPRRQPVYRWQSESLVAKSFLKQILPYLVLKQERAKVALLYQETVTDRGVAKFLPEDVLIKRKGLYEDMKTLNDAYGRRRWLKQHNELEVK